MQLIVQLGQICRRSAQLTLESARQTLRETMPAFADLPDVAEVFRFVVDMGAVGTPNAPFLQELQAFHSVFENPKAPIRGDELERFH